MKIILFINILFLVGCSQQQELKIGQKVTNGLCEGYISAQSSSEFRVAPWICKDITFNFAWVPKDQLKALN